MSVFKLKISDDFRLEEYDYSPEYGKVEAATKIVITSKHKEINVEIEKI